MLNDPRSFHVSFAVYFLTDTSGLPAICVYLKNAFPFNCLLTFVIDPPFQAMESSSSCHFLMLHSFVDMSDMSDISDMSDSCV